MDLGLLSKRIPIKKKANPLSDLIPRAKKNYDPLTITEEENKSESSYGLTPVKQIQEIVDKQSNKNNLFLTFRN